MSAASLLTLCAAPVDVSPTAVPTANATAIHETAIACAWIDATNTAVAATQTEMVGTATPAPTTTPWVPTVHIVQPGEISCLNIAAEYGLTLQEFYEANPSLNNQCNISVGDSLVIPPIPLYEPSNYVSQYHCVPSGEGVCLSPNDPPELMIAHTLFGEGGSSIGVSSSKNIMQVALNRVDAYLGKRDMSTADLSREDFAKLLVRVMAQPYDTGAGYSEPAFNAFSEPYPHENTPGENNWDETFELVQSILNGRGQAGTGAESPLVNPNVTTYCSQDAGLPDPEDPTPGDGNSGIAVVEEGGGRKQFYFNDGRIPNCR